MNASSFPTNKFVEGCFPTLSLKQNDKSFIFCVTHISSEVGTIFRSPFMLFIVADENLMRLQCSQELTNINE